MKPVEYFSALSHGMRMIGFDTMAKEYCCLNWTVAELKTWTDRQLAVLNSELFEACEDKTTGGKARATYQAVRQRVVKVRVDRAHGGKSGKKNGITKRKV